MLRLFGREWSKKELLRHVGSIHQVGGVRRVCFDEGAGKGISSAMFNTGQMSCLRHLFSATHSQKVL